MKIVKCFLISLSLAGYLFHYHHHKKPSKGKMEKEVVAILGEEHPLVKYGVIGCESGYYQSDNNGGPLLGRKNRDDSYDLGAAQINSCHWQEARKLGFDLESLEGNLGYANLLFEREGLRPWYSSKACWGKNL